MQRQSDNIILLGTSHVAKTSAQEIKEAIETLKPELVCIELDYARFKALFSKNKSKSKSRYTIASIKKYGFFGYCFAKLASSMQKTIAKHLGVDPGVDMKTAYKEARKHKIPTALIDMNFETTLKKFSAMPFKAKVGMLTKSLSVTFKKEYRKILHFDPKTVPSEEQLLQILQIIKKEFPEYYKILIEDRNSYMAKKLVQLQKEHKGTILAVVGAGHVEGMLEYLNSVNTDPNTIQFSFRIDQEN